MSGTPPKADLTSTPAASSSREAAIGSLARRQTKLRGATLRYLPQYSPDLNPIEMPFSKLPEINVRKIRAKSSHVRARALWGLTRNLRKPRNTAKCLPTPSLHFCYPGGTGSAAWHNPHDARDSGSSLGAAPRSEFALQRQPLCATGRARTAADTNAVHDTLLQSMRVRFSDSEQWSSPVKPPRSQNYVKPHNSRTRVHVAKPAGL
jgi:hypothetical protein